MEYSKDGLSHSTTTPTTTTTINYKYINKFNWYGLKCIVVDIKSQPYLERFRAENITFVLHWFKFLEK